MGTRGSEQVLQLDDPLEAALQPAMLLDHSVVHAADRLLDTRDLAAGRIGGAGGGGCLGPVPENRPCPLHLPAGAYDDDDLERTGLVSRAPAQACGAPPHERSAVDVSWPGLA